MFKEKVNFINIKNHGIFNLNKSAAVKKKINK